MWQPTAGVSALWPLLVGQPPRWPSWQRWRCCRHARPSSKKVKSEPAAKDRSGCGEPIAEEMSSVSQEAKSRSRVLRPPDEPGTQYLCAEFVLDDPSSSEKRISQEASPKMHEPGPKGQLGFDFELSFDTWCSHLTVNCLRSRTPFSEFLAKSMKCRVAAEVLQAAASSTVFPLPAPFESPFDRMPKGVSSRVRKKIYFQRAMHCVVMALNFWHCGGDFSVLDQLHRTPTAGRKFPQLVARIQAPLSLWLALGFHLSPTRSSLPVPKLRSIIQCCQSQSRWSIQDQVERNRSLGHHWFPAR